MQLRGKRTIILVTHQINYLFDCDWIIVMDNGGIKYQDEPNNLKA
jgi:ABC-type multidrug transport system ATPase subunit